MLDSLLYALAFWSESKWMGIQTERGRERERRRKAWIGRRRRRISLENLFLPSFFLGTFLGGWRAFPGGIHGHTARKVAMAIFFAFFFVWRKIL